MTQNSILILATAARKSSAIPDQPFEPGTLSKAKSTAISTATTVRLRPHGAPRASIATALRSWYDWSRLVNVAKQVNLYEAKTNLSDLVERAARGEEIIIAKAGLPRARLVPLAKPSKPRRPGAWKGRVVIGPDFDAPLPEEILAAFEGQKK